MLRTEIKKHLRSKGSITRLEALGLYGCMDITTVIRDLRKAGMKIKTHMKADNNGKRYARYTVRTRSRQAAV